MPKQPLFRNFSQPFGAVSLLSRQSVCPVKIVSWVNEDDQKGDQAGSHWRDTVVSNRRWRSSYDTICSVAIYMIDQPQQPRPQSEVPKPIPGLERLDAASKIAPPPVSVERPIAIATVCILLGLGWAASLFELIGLVVIFQSNPAFLLTAILPSFMYQLLLLLTIYGFWLMRKWSVYLYTFMFAVSVVTSLNAIAASPGKLLNLGYLVSVIVVWVGFHYLDQFS
jgi:hypothetical protein